MPGSASGSGHMATGGGGGGGASFVEKKHVNPHPRVAIWPHPECHMATEVAAWWPHNQRQDSLQILYHMATRALGVCYHGGLLNVRA